MTKAHEEMRPSSVDLFIVHMSGQIKDSVEFCNHQHNKPSTTTQQH